MSNNNPSQYISNPRRAESPKQPQIASNPKPVQYTPLEARSYQERLAREFEIERERKLRDAKLAEMAAFQQASKVSQKSETSLLGAKTFHNVLAGHNQEQLWTGSAQYYDEPLSKTPFDDYEGSEVSSFPESFPKIETSKAPPPKESVADLPKVGETCILHNGEILKISANEPEILEFIQFLVDVKNLNIDDLMIMKRVGIGYGLRG